MGFFRNNIRLCCGARVPQKCWLAISCELYVTYYVFWPTSVLNSDCKTTNPHAFLASVAGGQVPACFWIEIIGHPLFSWWDDRCFQCFLILCWHTDLCLCGHDWPVPCKFSRFGQQIRLLVDSDHGTIEDLKPGKTLKWREERIQYKSPLSWWTLGLQMFVFTPVNRYP